MSRLIIVFVLTFTSSTIFAQQTYVLNKDQSKVLVQGTSSLHDWESNVEKMDGNLVFTIEEGKPNGIENLQINVDASSIKSGKRIMDNKTKDALEAKNHPNITFTFGEFVSMDGDSVTVSGTLQIAGVDQSVELTGAYSLQNDGSVLIEGAEALKMSSYGIDAPTAMMGTLKTGDEVTIAYNVLFSPKK